MTILKRFLDEVEGRDGIAQCDKIWQIFPRLGKNLKVLCNLSRVHSIFGKILYQLWKILMLLGKFSLLQMTKYWKTDQTVWSHWRLGSKTCVPCKRWFANLNVTSRVRRRRRLVKRLSTFLSHFSHFWGAFTFYIADLFLRFWRSKCGLRSWGHAFWYLQTKKRLFKARLHDENALG